MVRLKHTSYGVQNLHEFLRFNKRGPPWLEWLSELIECRPANPKVAGSIPSQGTCLGCSPGPQ